MERGIRKFSLSQKVKLYLKCSSKVGMFLLCTPPHTLPYLIFNNEFTVPQCKPNPFFLDLFFGRMWFVFCLSRNRFIVYCSNRNGQENVATKAYLSLGADRQVRDNSFASHYFWNLLYTYILTARNLD